MSSAYEQQRLANIERNHAELKRLGLLSPHAGGVVLSSSQRGTTRKRSRQHSSAWGGRNESSQDLRRSESRARRSLRLAAVPGATSGRPEPPQNSQAEQVEHGEAEWAQVLFDRFAGQRIIKVGQEGDARWDRRRAHQHLTLSKCGRVVATTGCAGYGAALAKPPTAAEQLRVLRWDVEVLRLGTGGFAVGVSRTSMSPPFKSLGNSSQSWVAHCDGRTLHNRTTLCDAETGGCTFGVGDIISVCLEPFDAAKGPSRARQLKFEKNGAPIGPSHVVPATKSAGAFTLAVQPYMGGAARLL